MKHYTSVMFQHLCRLIGETPLSRISCTYKGQRRDVYVKHEHYNLTGSIKDRMALYILYKAYQEGVLTSDTILAEATSGNTGIALSAIGSALGHKVRIFMPDWMSPERINLIRSFGADIRLVSAEEGGFKGSIALAEAYAEDCPEVFLPSQFSNVHNCEAHKMTTGPELFHQLAFLGLEPDAFLAGVGTGGTIMGVGQYLREKDGNTLLFPLEPSSSPTLSTGHKVGKHRIEGISDEFIPDIVCLDTLDDIVEVDDGDAIIMAQRLAKELGMGVGISSGANFLGVLKALEKIGPDKIVATVFSDDNKKYLSTDLMREEPLKEGFLTPDIENLRLETVVNVEELNVREDVFAICDEEIE